MSYNAPGSPQRKQSPLAPGCNKDVSTQTKELANHCCGSVPCDRFLQFIPCDHRPRPVLPKRTARTARGTLKVLGMGPMFANTYSPLTPIDGTTVPTKPRGPS